MSDNQRHVSFWCLVSDKRHHVWWLMSDVLCLITNVMSHSDVLCLISDVWCSVSKVWCLITDVLCLMSDVLCQISDLLLLVSDVLCLISNIWCPMSDFLSGVWCLRAMVRKNREKSPFCGKSWKIDFFHYLSIYSF